MPTDVPSENGEGRGICRDCLQEVDDSAPRCGACHGPRLLRHPELTALSIAHLDCDAFYAAVEKRDNPELRDVPVIIGGGKRGVVSTACYIARISGVKSAMPMFEARKLCPDAIVISPRMDRYVEVGREVRQIMLEFTPLVEPVSIDEAFLDLTGTERLHRACPALALARMATRIEQDIGITVSIGLSYNKFLAKVASDLDKPRGFSVLGRADAQSFLAGRPVSLIWGVGKVTQETLARNGITTIGQLQKLSKSDLTRAYGALGPRLFHLARGEDARRVSIDDDTKSIGSETTFFEDLSDLKKLQRLLWRQAERVSARAKRARLAGSTVTLKLKTTDFKLRTRSRSLSDPTQLAERIYEAARRLLENEADGTRYRLLGVSISTLSPATQDAELSDLDLRLGMRARAERAMDKLKSKFGRKAVEKGLAFEVTPEHEPEASERDLDD
jgi:DNA polymerase IV